MDLLLNKSLRCGLEQYGSTERNITFPTLATVVAGSSSSFPTLVIFISTIPTFLTAEGSDTHVIIGSKVGVYESFGSFKVGGTVGDGNCGTWSGKIWWILCWWRGSVGGDSGEKGVPSVRRGRIMLLDN